MTNTVEEAMTIKYVDKNGSLKVVTVEDDAEFSVKESADGTYYIFAFKSAHARGSRTRTQSTLAELLDKTTADKCINAIYDQLIAKKDYCDLSEIQLGKSEDTNDIEDTNDN